MAIKSSRSFWRALPLLALTAVLAGCGLIPTPRPAATPTPKPTPVPARRPRPTMVRPTETPVPDPHVNFTGVTFDYDLKLGGAIGVLMPADTPEIGSPDWMLPNRIEFSVVGYPIVKTVQIPRIAVFPIPNMTGFNDAGAARIQALSEILARKPDPDTLTGHIPQLSDIQNEELMHAQVKYLDFKNGSGVRFIAEYSLDMRPVNNEDLVYIFQGITADGNYYVSVLLPVQQKDLIASEDKMTNAQADEMVKDYIQYLKDHAHDLDIAGDASFNPKLSLLDNVIQSMNIAPGELPVITAPPPTEDTGTDEATDESGDDGGDGGDGSTP